MKDPHLRAGNDFDPAGLPDSFVIDYFALVENPRQIEGEVHRKIYNFRYKKEWFRCSVLTAIEAIRSVIGAQVLYEYIGKNQPVLTNALYYIRLEMPLDHDCGTLYLIPKGSVRSLPKINRDGAYIAVDAEVDITEIKLSGDIEAKWNRDLSLILSLDTSYSDDTIPALVKQVESLPINSIRLAPYHVEKEGWRDIYNCKFETLLVANYAGTGGFFNSLPKVDGLQRLALNYSNPIQTECIASLARCSTLHSIYLRPDSSKIVNPSAFLKIPESVFMTIGGGYGLGDDWFDFFLATRKNLTVDAELEGWVLPFLKNHDVFSRLSLTGDDLQQPKTIGILEGMSRLVYLKIADGSLNNGFFEALPNCKILEEVHIQRTDPASFTGRAISALRNCSSIKSLWLGGAPEDLVRELRMELPHCFISNEDGVDDHTAEYCARIKEDILCF